MTDQTPHMQLNHISFQSDQPLSVAPVEPLSQPDFDRLPFRGGQNRTIPDSFQEADLTITV